MKTKPWVCALGVALTSLVVGTAVHAQSAFCSNDGHDHCNPRAHQFERGFRDIGVVDIADAGGLGRIEVHGDRAAVLQKDEGIVTLLDVSDPQRPTVSGHYDDDAQQSLDGDLAFSEDGNWLFYARQTVNFSRDGVHVLNVSDPAAPQLAHYQVAGGSSRVLYHQDEQGEWVVVLDAITGMVVNLFEPTTGALIPVFASAMPATKVGGPASAGLALSTTDDETLLYVTTGRTGLEIFDFDNPMNPRLVGTWAEEVALAEVEVARVGKKNLVYAATEYWFNKNLSPEVIVLDATNPSEVKRLGTWSTGLETGDLWRLQGMAVAGRLLVAAHSHAGVVAFDSKGRTPFRTDSYSPPRAEAPSGPASPYAYDVEAAGSFIYVTDSGSGSLTVLRRG